MTIKDYSLSPDDVSLLLELLEKEKERVFAACEESMGQSDYSYWEAKKVRVDDLCHRFLDRSSLYQPNKSAVSAVSTGCFVVAI